MNVLLPLLIVAINPEAPIEARYPGATEVFHCPFDEAWDTNFDGVPDRWIRRKGPGFPHFVAVGISQQPSPVGNRCLEMKLDGGAAAIYSPPIPVGPSSSYVLEGILQTEGLEHDRAYLSLTLLDGGRHRLESFDSQRIRDSQGWRKLRLGPVTPAGDGVRFAVVGLHLEPGSRADLTGSARFDDVWLGRLPRISLSAGNGHHVFTDPGQITITCSATGLSHEDPPVVFQLEDVLATAVAQQRLQLATGNSRPSPDNASDDPPGTDGHRPKVGPLVVAGTAEWKPPVPGPGFYRVRATVDGGGDVAYQGETTLAVIRPRRGSPESEFGWSLPQGDQPLALADLTELVGQAGIGWVKYPLWLDEKASDERVQELVRFSQALTAEGIELVGLLGDPPDALRSRFGEFRSPVEIFVGDTNLWYPSLEAAIMRTGIRVRWWQLGQDKDTGFVGYRKLAEKAAAIKAQLDQLSYDANLGFGWRWTSPLPESTERVPPWRFLSLSADPPPAEQELSAYLAATTEPQVRRWVVLEPLGRDRYPLETRAADLLQRMVLAKAGGAEGIFIPDPFSADRGLMNEDGTAGELLLVWRTTALMLGGAEYLGSIQMPGGSKNHIFARGPDAVMVVSSATPKQEVIYLGRNVRQLDLWGRDSAANEQEHRQVVEVGPLPTIVTGVDEKILRWRQSLLLARDRVVEVLGSPHQNSFLVKNPFDGEVSGHVELVVPDSWELSPRGTDFRLAGGETLQQPFQITLPYNATSGRHLVHVDFELDGEPATRFSAYRHIDVGPGDVHIEVITRLNERGDLEVEQRFVNQTQGPVSFRCHLLAPDQRRQTTQLIGLAPGRDVNVYRLPNGEQLIGKTLWLRAEEIDGPRVLNYRFIAQGS